MTDTGWVKIYRSMTDWRWYTNLPVKTLFLHLLLIANHRDQDWDGITVKRGQCITGRKQLATETGLTEQQVRTALHKLTVTQEITTESTNRYTLITLVNYERYQAQDMSCPPAKQPTNNQQTTNKQPTDNQQITTNKNDKNVKNDKNEKNIYEVITNLYNEICISYPKLTKLSDRRIKTLNARLKKYSVEDFRTLFEKAEASDFLKGSNQKDWSANFDWLVKDTNMAKVIDGNYDNKARKGNKSDDNWNFSDFIYGGSD